MKVKICGTTHLEDALFCEALQVDFLGFIFHPDSPRYLEYSTAKSIISSLNYAKPIGVFVDHTPDEIARVAQDLKLWGVQIYHDYDLTGFPFEVIRAHRFRGPADTLILRDLLASPLYDYVLVDAYHERHVGGTGQGFDWSLLPADLSRIFLAGGIGLHNIDAVKSLQPFAIDLVSGVERIPGRKDFTKLQALMEKLK